MGTELDKFGERYRQRRVQRHEALSTRNEGANTLASDSLGTLSAGTPVFDTVTGHTGTVSHATREHVINAPA